MKSGNRATRAEPAREDSEAKAIQRTAAEWLARREAEALSPAEEAQFEHWRTADSRHEAAYSELQRAWKTLDQLREYPRQMQASDDPDLLVPRSRVQHFVAPVVWSVAACLAVAVLLWRRGDFAQPLSPATTTAAESENHFLHLPDGSEVEVRAGGNVVTHFTPTERRVSLLQGEARFVVAKNPARPFVVEAEGVLVRDIGTVFDVRLAAARVEVLVTEGTVQVRPPAPSPATPDWPAPLVLVAGQHTVVNTDSGSRLVAPVVDTLSSVQLDRALAWENSSLLFDAKPLSEVVASINQLVAEQKGSIRLVVEDPKLAGVRITGRIRADNIENFVETLETNFGVVADHRDDGQIVLRQGP